jgi:hypothetical protein
MVKFIGNDPIANGVQRHLVGRGQRGQQPGVGPPRRFEQRAQRGNAIGGDAQRVPPPVGAVDIR